MKTPEINDPEREGAEASPPTSLPTRRAVLDASAICAMLFAEPGAEAVAEEIAFGSVLSTVNLSEVATVLVRRDLDPSAILEPVLQQVNVEALSVEDAIEAARLYRAGQPFGMSLGDRICLAVAKRLELRAVTAERAWLQGDFGVEVTLIRPGPDG